MQKVNVPDSAFSELEVTLGGNTYIFRYSYTYGYHLDILFEGEVLIAGLKLVEGVFLLKKYDLPNFNHGDLVVVKLKDTDETVNRNNIGFGKAYELIYISNEELGG